MQFPSAMLGGDLRSGNDFQAAPGGRPGGRHAAGGVVIGDGDGGQAAAPGQIDNLGGGVQPVAEGGVQVQIGPAGVPAAGELLTEVSERLAGRHQLKG